MENKNLLLILGIAITGLGIVFPIEGMDKSMILTNVILFILLSYAGVIEVSNQKGVSLKDFDVKIDKYIAEGKEENDYKKIILYSSIRPLIMVALIILSVNILSFLVFLR